MENISKFNVARRLEKRSLLIAINCVAGLSIFFFGYDQGVMGGVNTNQNYATTMQFGHWDPVGKIVVVDNQLLQGGIVCLFSYCQDLHLMLIHPRLLSITWVPCLELCSEDGSEIDTDASRLSRLRLCGPSSELHCSARLKMPIG